MSMSSFLRKRVRGLLKTTFSGGNDSAGNANGAQLSRDDSPPPPDNAMEHSELIYDRMLSGRPHRKADVPETYSGKTGLDLPVIKLGALDKRIRSSVTGPEGGVTNVQGVRQAPLVRIANLDDELSLSSYDEDFDNPVSPGGMTSSKSIEALGFNVDDLVPSCSSTRDLNWARPHTGRSFGASTSLYEKHPISNQRAGTPIADVFAIIARENNALMALADGVNWGVGSRLAARCAVRGALDHLNEAVEEGRFKTTTDVFHSMLGAFHAGHTLILQEGGALTTLCVAVVTPIRDSESYVLCVCNVGDSLCFVYNPAYGVREVTQASHDIAQIRDMRDAGGALGPVDGRNPQLHNLTCSMTFVQEGDVVFITSDGISDNFDPVVGKFCSAKKPEIEKENVFSFSVTQTEKNGTRIREAVSAKCPAKPAKPYLPAVPSRRRCNATTPSVNAPERHELMLARMADVITHGITRLGGQFVFDGNLSGEQLFDSHDEEDTESGLGTPSSQHTEGGGSKNAITAADVCKNLMTFAHQLSAAKRRTLEDPELYRAKMPSKSEERIRRQMIRSMILDMPGKLDHASVVAFKVGVFDDDHEAEPDFESELVETPLAPVPERSIAPIDQAVNASALFCRPMPYASTRVTVVAEEKISVFKDVLKTPSDIPTELTSPAKTKPKGSPHRPPLPRSTRSPYEEIPELNSPTRATPKAKGKKGHHARGSIARHTLGVDVAWLKKLVGSGRPASPVTLRSPDGPPRSSHALSRASVGLESPTSPVSPLSPGSPHQKFVPGGGGGGAFSIRRLFNRPPRPDGHQVIPYASSSAR